MRDRQQSKRITRGDIRLLFASAAFLGAVILKVSGIPWAESIRVQTVNLLHGGIPAEELLQAAGRTLEDGGLQAVFAGLEQGVRGSFPEQEETSVQVYAESGYGEDELKTRETSNFPKEADETAYLLKFKTETPVEGVVSSEFGARTHPISGKESFHFGLDLAAEEGTPIYAFADATVREIGKSSYGNYAVLDHTEGFSTLYAHCSRIDVKEGETVSAGRQIAAVGATGNATGNHLHFEIWRDGKALNPSHYIRT